MTAQKYIRAEQRRFRRAAEGRTWTVKDLPQYYYHKNFSDMLTYVSTRYTNLMDTKHTKFIRDFEALPFSAQCAYARIAGRKGHIFNIHHLKYDEIKNIPEQFEILATKNFTNEVKESDFKNFLMSLTKPNLIKLIEARLCESLYKRSWNKSKLVEITLSHVDFEDIQISSDFIVQSRLETYHYLLFLYFGRIETSLQSKTLGDLGLVRPSFSRVDKTHFTSFEQANSAYFYAKALDDYYRKDFSLLWPLIETVNSWPQANDTKTEVKRGVLLQKLGKICERQGETEKALELYSKSDSDRCNERIIRIRYRRNFENDREWVQSRLESIIENPESDDEHAFAQDFYARKFNKKRTSLVTDILRSSETLFLDEAYRNVPERAAANHFKAKGQKAYHTENNIWQSLFGLLFWDEIFSEENPKAWSLPDSLKIADFYGNHRISIEEKLEGLSHIKPTMLSLLKTMTTHYGRDNGVFMWGPKSLDLIKTLINNSPTSALASMLRLMAKDYSSTKDGFPDLMVIQNGEIRFIEIKAEGDVLRRNQLTRLRQLKASGFDAKIMRINWHVDPEQIYVVVDVETTGGRAGLHRVTEIGAVKMQAGEIIDEWSSLINPQRSIPPNITRLTGISEAMVADAPIFAEIADSFADFMGEAIFAAHNVNFDYGFIRSEYQMIDRKFKHPKICTCSSMRKLYPGYNSYSLKNLCHEFQIGLESHHRALCDAKAAAELLKMVNDKRIDLQEDVLTQ